MTSSSNRQLVMRVKRVLGGMELLSEQKASGVMALGGSSTKAGHRVLWTERDEGHPQSLHEVWVGRFRQARSRLEVEEGVVAAEEALKDARVRSSHSRIDGDWRPIFIAKGAGTHYVAAAIQWNISASYARKLRQQNHLSACWGGPICGQCGDDMHPAEGVVPIWRCDGCARELQRGTFEDLALGGER